MPSATTTYARYHTRRPSHPVSRSFSRALLPAAIFVAVTATAGFLSSDYFRLREVFVKAPDTGLADEVAGALQVPAGANTIFLSESRLASQAKACPRVLDAEVDRDLPGTVTLRIEQREPVFALKAPNGYVLVDREGVLILHTARPGPEYPRVHDNNERDRVIGGHLNPDCLKTVLACIEGARQGDMDLDFDLHLEERFDYRLVPGSGVTVKMGGPDNLARKVILAGAIDRHLRERNLRAEYIDVRLPDRPPCYRLKSDTPDAPPVATTTTHVQ